MKQWIYPKKCVVQVNDSAKDMSGEIGKYGVLVERISTPMYDYEVELETGNHGRFKESELDYFFKKGDKLKVKHTGEIGKIIHYEIIFKQVELIFNDGSTKVYFFSQVELEEKSDDMTRFSNAELHKQILDTLHEIYVTKNADYGNSFEEQFKEYGKLSGVIRIDDKVRRLKQLSKQLAQVKDESFEDTLYDLANYSIMLLMEMIKEKGNK